MPEVQGERHTSPLALPTRTWAASIHEDAAHLSAMWLRHVRNRRPNEFSWLPGAVHGIELGPANPQHWMAQRMVVEDPGIMSLLAPSRILCLQDRPLCHQPLSLKKEESKANAEIRSLITNWAL